MKEILTTTGRSSRSTFWIVNGGIFAIIALMGGILENLPVPEWASLVIGFSVFPMILVSIMVQIRRWHDRDKSGLWVFINFIPFFGGLWTLIECGFLEGTRGGNRFGPDPLAERPPPLPTQSTA